MAVTRMAPDAWCDCGISKYHVEASGDDFNMICMHLGLPVAAKMNYKHDFPEMYNHVSQVVFFHNSEYQRVARAKLEALDSGCCAAGAGPARPPAAVPLDICQV